MFKPNTRRIGNAFSINDKNSTKSKQLNKTSGNLKWRRSARKFLEGYLNTSTLHGLKYIADPSPWKSLLWICILIASIIFCAILIKVQMSKFNQSNMTTSIASTADPVWTVPFPAVTICNNIVVSKSGITHIAKKLQEQGVEDDQINKFLTGLNHFVTHNALTNEDIENYRNISRILSSLGYNTDRLMYEVAIPCEKQFKFCQWKMETENCSDLFYMIKTTRGYCCSFNAFGATTFQHNYRNLSKIVHFLGSAGKNSGLVVKIDAMKHDNFSSISSVNGFEVYIHDGADYPDFSLYAKTLPVTTALTMSLTPSIIDSHFVIRNIPQYTRGCRYEDENKLAWSPTYNFQTCLNECKADIMYEFCKCIPYYYPNTGFFRSCALEDMGCLKSNQKIVNSLLLVTERNDVSQDVIREHLGDVRECNCLPDCNDVHYDMSMNTMGDDKMLNENTSVLRVHYSTISCIRYLKDVYYTWDMLVAAVGGIFGLCLGGSLISAIEIFYYVATYFADSRTAVKKKAIENLKMEIKSNIKTKNQKRIRRLYPVFEYTP